MINPDDELFWRKVREAYDQVNSNKEQAVTITVGDREAVVSQQTGTFGKEFILVQVSEVEVKPPTLIVP